MLDRLRGDPRGRRSASGSPARRPSLGWGFLYIAIPAFALIVLRWAWFELVFWLMLVTWATDIFAYFAGRSIGGPKLAPRISPNKTWAGLIGGMAGAAVVGALAAQLFRHRPRPSSGSGALMGLIAQLGDLYESSVKRRLGVKDSGSILPGHGGVLDRLDGLLAGRRRDLSRPDRDPGSGVTDRDASPSWAPPARSAARRST